MKKIALCFVIFLTAATLQAQSFDSTYVFQIIKGRSDTLKAVFEWVAQNISYDVPQKDESRLLEDKKILLDEVWKSRKGVCQHYSELLNAFYTKAGFQAYVVNGYAIDKGEEFTDVGHAWNVVKWQGKWRCMDATWAAGHLEENRFVKLYTPGWFMPKADTFVFSHIPFDPAWQLLDVPLSKQQIKQKQQHPTGQKLDYEKILRDFFPEPNIATKEASLKRVIQFTDDNPLRKVYIRDTEEEIRIRKENEEVKRVNYWVDTLNVAVARYNDLVNWYNSRYKKPNWTDEQVKAKMAEMQRLSAYLRRNIKSLDVRAERLQSLVAFNRNNFEKLEKDVFRFQNFVDKYLKTAVAERKTLNL